MSLVHESAEKPHARFVPPQTIKSLSYVILQFLQERTSERLVSQITNLGHAKLRLRFIDARTTRQDVRFEFFNDNNAHQRLEDTWLSSESSKNYIIIDDPRLIHYLGAAVYITDKWGGSNQRNSVLLVLMDGFTRYPKGNVYNNHTVRGYEIRTTLRDDDVLVEYVVTSYILGSGTTPADDVIQSVTWDYWANIPKDKRTLHYDAWITASKRRTKGIDP